MAIEEILLEKTVDVVMAYAGPAIALIRDKVARKRAEEQVASGQAFKAYYSTTIPKYAQTKTILYRTKPVSLYSFYVNLDLRRATEAVPTHTVMPVLECGRRLVITGGAGSGKSTLLKHLFLNTIEVSAGIPLFVELRYVQRAPQALEDLLFDTARSANLKLDRDIFCQLLAHGRFVIFLDGFDELAPNVMNRMAYLLNDFCDRHPAAITILTSRPSHSFIGWTGFVELAIAPLTRDRCLGLIEKLDYDSQVKAAFAAAVRDRLFSTHESFLANPLLATLMLMTFEQFGNIEQQMHLFYGQAFDTLFMKHDATKVGYRRHMYSKLNADDFRAAIAAFCVQMYFAGKVTFSEQEAFEAAARCPTIVPLRGDFDSAALIRDLTASVCLLLQDGLQLAFAHRSFQEYFAAVFILNHAQGRRRELLATLRPRLTTDTTAKMVFDMNQAVFEEDFLKDALEDVRQTLRWTKEEDGQQVAMRFIGSVFTPMHLSDRTIEFAFDGAEGKAAEAINIVRFVWERYRGPFILLDQDKLRAASKAIRRRIGRTRRRVIRVDYEGAVPKRTRFVRLDSDDFSRSDLAEPLGALFQPLIEALKFALTLVESIAVQRARQQRAIDALLVRKALPSS